jgi:hypothetical protein
MRILIPRDLHIGSTEFDALNVGQGIHVKLLRSRFQVNDAFIQSVGLYEGLAPAAAAGKDEEAKADAEDTLIVEPELEPEPEVAASAPATEVA